MESLPVTILFVEDNRPVLDLVKEILELEGWIVVAYEDASAALRELASDDKYDLIITDNDLPGVCGLQLVISARKLAQYKHTPIIMLSADTTYQKQAVVAGADVFLRKPEDISTLTATVSRLLKLNALKAIQPV